MNSFRSTSSWLQLRDVQILLSLWGLAYVFNLYFSWMGRHTISSQTHILVTISVLFYVVVRWLGEAGLTFFNRKVNPDDRETLRDSIAEPRGWDMQSLIFMGGMLLAIAAVGIRYLSTERNMSLFEIREFHRTNDASSGILTLISSGCMAFFYFGWVRFWSSGPSRSFNAILAILSLLCVYMLAKITGGRSELLIVLAIGLFGMIAFRIHRFGIKHLLSLFGISILLFGAHTLYSTVRTFEDGDVEDHSRLLNQSAQVPWISTSSPLYVPAQLAFAMTGDYFGNNLSVLSTYLDSDYEAPLWGAYSFAAVSSRLRWLSLDDRQQRKLEIDIASSETGDSNNVWGTAFRELHVDFGYFGCPIVFLLLGLLVNSCSRRLSDLTIQTVACVGAFLVLSPFTNALLARSFELWIAAIAVWWVIDLWIKNLPRFR